MHVSKLEFLDSDVVCIEAAASSNSAITEKCLIVYLQISSVPITIIDATHIPARTPSPAFMIIDITMNTKR